MNKIDPSQYEDRLATEENVKEIILWLKDDYDKFFEEKDSLEKGQQEKRLLVLIEKRSDRVVAFCLSGLTKAGGVFVVHPEMRAKPTANMDRKTVEMTGGRGIGTRLFECCLERAKRDGKAGLSIQCSSEGVAEFWSKCGFQITEQDSNGTIRAVYPIPRQFELPENLKSVKVTFELNHEWDEKWQAPMPFTTDAAMIKEGTYQLQNRFVEYIPYSDIPIRIQIDGQEINNKKVKYSTEFGVRYNLQKHGPFVVVDQISWKANQSNE
tara:strand:+ start:4761 stop:5561 length:801 start_codon:yes stop_codon:yes gene_type:complete